MSTQPTSTFIAATSLLLTVHQPANPTSSSSLQHTGTLQTRLDTRSTHSFLPLTTVQSLHTIIHSLPFPFRVPLWSDPAPSHQQFYTVTHFTLLDLSINNTKQRLGQHLFLIVDAKVEGATEALVGMRFAKEMRMRVNFREGKVEFGMRKSCRKEGGRPKPKRRGTEVYERRGEREVNAPSPPEFPLVVQERKD